MQRPCPRQEFQRPLTTFSSSLSATWVLSSMLVDILLESSISISALQQSCHSFRWCFEAAGGCVTFWCATEGVNLLKVYGCGIYESRRHIRITLEHQCMTMSTFTPPCDSSARSDSEHEISGRKRHVNLWELGVSIVDLGDHLGRLRA